MSMRALIGGLAVALSLAVAQGTGGAMASKPHTARAQVQCTAAGTKLFSPPLAAAAVCARFTGAVRTGLAPGDSLAIALRFLPNGVATAIVSRSRGGKPQPPVDFNLAVSDRHFTPGDLDRLAADVVAGMRKKP